jgi:hypothetical protein
LSTFAAAYSATSKSATENEAATYSMTILSPGAPGPRTVKIAMPPKIKSGLMDGF